MRLNSLVKWLVALAAMAAMESHAYAAWNNVFQVCCTSCSTPAPVVAGYYAEASCDPVPSCPPVCTTRYVQRTYYEPVVTYKPQTYTEAVTTYQTQYYTEACTSYRYTCAYNPCTCRYEQVAQPVTSYRVRSKCCPVTSYLQRTCMVPVMSQRAVTMYEPVLSCSPTSNAPAVAVVPSPSTIAPPQAAPPSGTERRDPNSALPAPPPGGTEKSELAPDTAQPRYGPPVPMNPSASRSISKPAPSLRFDRTASVDGSSVLGRMTDEGRVPLSQSRVLFVNADDKNEQYQATTDGDGVFRTRLASGGWLVYTFDAKGKPVFSRRIEVTKDKGVNFTLVNR